MPVKVGDYVKAVAVSHVPFAETEVDMDRQGLVVEFRDDGAQLVLETWQGTEFVCYTEGAVALDVKTLDPAIREFIIERKRTLPLP